MAIVKFEKRFKNGSKQVAEQRINGCPIKWANKINLSGLNFKVQIMEIIPV